MFIDIKIKGCLPLEDVEISKCASYPTLCKKNDIKFYKVPVFSVFYTYKFKTFKSEEDYDIYSFIYTDGQSSRCIKMLDNKNTSMTDVVITDKCNSYAIIAVYEEKRIINKNRVFIEAVKLVYNPTTQW